MCEEQQDTLGEIIYIYIYMCVCVCVCVCVHLYVLTSFIICIYIYIHTHTHKYVCINQFSFTYTLTRFLSFYSVPTNNVFMQQHSCQGQKSRTNTSFPSILRSACFYIWSCPEKDNSDF
jgi:hypothetical protein